MPTGPTEFIGAVRDGFPDGADGVPQYRRLADLVRELIENGELARGSRLPSERELADAASVSRTTVIAAYNLLRADSLVTSQGRAGTWVAAPSP